MTKEKKTEGCVATAAGPVVPKKVAGPEPIDQTRQETIMQVMVGKEAPDFEAAAFQKSGFANIKLSDFRGKWVFLCFYPGDFTFV